MEYLAVAAAKGGCVSSFSGVSWSCWPGDLCAVWPVQNSLELVTSRPPEKPHLTRVQHHWQGLVQMVESSRVGVWKTNSSEQSGQLRKTLLYFFYFSSSHFSTFHIWSVAFVLITTSSFHLSMEGICVSWAHLCIFAQMRHQRYCLGYLGIAYHHRGLRLKYLKQLTVTHVTLPRSSQWVSKGFTFL